MTGTRGRHARPPSQFRARCERVIDTLLNERYRRKVVVVGGTASLTLVTLLGGAVIWAAGSSEEPPDGAKARRAAAPGSPSPAVTGMSGDPDEVPDALAYLRVKDPEGEYVRHVEEVRSSGSFLRVYTDLEEGDENSKPAIALCEWTAEYLSRYDPGNDPIVFVHAEENDNGHVVLANKQTRDDDCRVGETR